jgi:hypothetical protein
MNGQDHGGSPEPMPTQEKSQAPAALRTGLALAVGYTAYFLALFAQFPLAGRLPGNCDTWYAIAFTNLYRNELKELLGLARYGTFLHPVAHPFAYGETSVVLAVVPMLLRSLGLGDLTAYYVFVSLAYAATAFATYLFATLYVERRTVAAVAGLLFASSNFLLSTIDSPHTAFFGLAFLSFYFFKRHLLTGRNRDLWWSAALAGAQAYVASYVFLLLAIAIGVLVLANLDAIRKQPRGLARVAAYAGVVALAAAPFFVFYLLKLTDHFDWRPQAVLFAEFNSLDPQDLLRAMPGNLIYPEGHRFDHRDAMALQRRLGRPDPRFATEDFAHMAGASPRDDEESLWVSSRRRAFIGLAPYLLAVVGLRRSFRGRRELLALLAVGFAIALGPQITVAGQSVPMPMYAVYELIPPAHVFRIPGRAFSLSVLAVAVLAAKGLERLLERGAGTSPRRTLAAGALVAALVVVENVPFPMRSFEAAAYVKPPADYLRFFAAQPGAVILNLPSGIGYGLAGSADDLYVFNRELIYVNWQTYHGQSIVNGVNGYIPRSRIAVQKLIARLPGEMAIGSLARMGVDFITFNKGLLLPGEAALLPRLRQAATLETVVDSESTVIFRVRR